MSVDTAIFRAACDIDLVRPSAMLLELRIKPMAEKPSRGNLLARLRFPTVVQYWALQGVGTKGK